MRLGIDFGTTRTVVAVARDGRYPVASFRTPDGFVDSLPGLGALASGALKWGTDVDFAIGEPLVRSVKATITGVAPDETISLAPGRDCSALTLVTEYLSYVRRMIVESSNLDVGPTEPLEAMIAVPAQASTRQRYLTLEAFSRAGFSVIGLVNEPTAGAIEFARHTLSALSSRSPKRYVVVYDWGGGTFDTAAVSLIDQRFDLLASRGISRLGGNDFDELILERVFARAGVDPASIGEPRRAHLLERCRMAKESVVTRSKRLFVDTSELLEVEQVSLDVAEIQESATPLIERTLDAMDQLFVELRDHGIDPENPRELGAVYLVGGSVHFPVVQRLLRQRFGRKIQLAPAPHASTAIGLAIAADPDAGIFVRESPTRHFGVWREGDEGREKIFDSIIEKRTGRSEGPVRVERSYRPAHQVGRLRFVECTELDEARQPQGEVTPWDSVLFPYDPALADHAELERYLEARAPYVLDEEIVETYEYTAAGLVLVQIENRTRGYRRAYVLGDRGVVGEGRAGLISGE